MAVRIARGVNRVWQRTGRVFADRYHDRILRTPREVRNALAYVLNNARRHGVALPMNAADPCSSATHFDGWRRAPNRPQPDITPSLPPPHTWLQHAGWRRHGLLPITPATR